MTSGVGGADGPGWIEGGSLRPIPLVGDVTRIVRRGAFDVFAVEREGSVGRRRFLFRVETGGLLVGPGDAVAAIDLIAVGGLASASEAPTPENPPDDAAFEAWMERLVDVCLPRPPVGRSEPAVAGETTLPAGGVLHAEPRAAFRLDILEGTARLADLRPLAPGTTIPFVGGGWLRAVDACRIRLIPSQASDAASRARLVTVCLEALADRFRRAGDADRRRAFTAADLDRRTLSGAMARLAGTVGVAPPSPHPGDAFAAAVGALATALGLDAPSIAEAIGESAGRGGPIDPMARLDRVTNLLSLGRRRVRLDDAAAKTVGVPLLCFRDPDGDPVALLPRADGWDMVDGAGRRPAGAADFAGLRRDALELHPTLPPNAATFSSFVRFGARGAGGDRARAVIASTLVAASALALPFWSHHVVDRIVPNGRVDALVSVIGALAVTAVAAVVFELFKSFATMRLQDRFALRSQSALMLRLLALPLAVHRAHTIGDLTDRVLGIEEANARLSGAVAAAVLGGAFGIVSLIPLAVLDLRLAAFAAVATAIVCLVLALLAREQLRREREGRRLQGALDGFVLQLINGIAKLRTAAAEPRAMARWAEAFAGRRERATVARAWSGRLQVAATVLPTLAGAALYAVIGSGAARGGANPMSAADFVVFATAFAQVMGSLTAATLAMVGTLDVVPLVERARPLLAAAVERDADAEAPGDLAGRIDLKRIRFRYAPDGPFVLDDLDLTIEAGRFVALVGASGSGKSTIGRLLLGFERPEVGDVLFDGRSARRLDMAAVRRRIGTVLQSGRLSSGSIFDNICGDSELGLEDAWEAARLAGVDHDIRDMPMGMHTVVTDGGGTLSGGQCQRILIARALVRRPAILFFDEATSALDNQTQAVVTETLTRTAVTRIVIAHRLSTVRAADRIVVIDRGRVAESGTYDDLIGRDGPFAALARRQLI